MSLHGFSNKNTLQDRLWDKIQILDDGCCWPWTGAIKKSTGYGDIYIGNGKNGTAHRAFYKIEVDPNIDGLDVDHLCANRWCMNPGHLEAVPSRINTLRGNGPSAMNARKTHCKNGHELSKSNIYMINNERRCKTCNSIKWKAWYYKRKEMGLGSYSGRK